MGSNFAPSSGSYLADPYEGELFVWFVCWRANVSAAQCEQLWAAKRAMLRSVEYCGATLQRGWWFSSHEQWKYLFLPYSDVAVNWRLFVNGERARTRFSAASGNPGLFASINNVTAPGPGRFSPSYLSANGLSPFAFSASQAPERVVAAPYASFSVMLADQLAGLQWWRSAASAGPFGTLESVLIDGSMDW